MLVCYIELQGKQLKRKLEIEMNDKTGQCDTSNIPCLDFTGVPGELFSTKHYQTISNLQVRHYLIPSLLGRYTHTHHH